jgi:predicted amidohydrolase
VSNTTLPVALVTEVFFGDPEGARATRETRDEDAEEPEGPRQRVMARAAADAGIALVGGAIVRDPGTGKRHNTAFLYSTAGDRLASYRKVHLPEEEGYWETSHYEPGASAPEVIDGLALAVGLQICSDVNRPQGFQLLAAQGAEVVFAPRATPPDTYERWKLILRANAVMSSAYVLSANRPRSERGAEIGGPSLAIAPNGDVVAETTDTIAVVGLSRDEVVAARREYPGYLERFPSLYADGWRHLIE